jgi:hypothetical protein
MSPPPELAFFADAQPPAITRRIAKAPCAVDDRSIKPTLQK